jgi:hypothetical protein
LLRKFTIMENDLLPPHIKREQPSLFSRMKSEIQSRLNKK